MEREGMKWGRTASGIVGVYTNRSSYLGIMSFPRTTDFIKLLEYQASGKLQRKTKHLQLQWGGGCNGRHILREKTSN